MRGHARLRFGAALIAASGASAKNALRPAWPWTHLMGHSELCARGILQRGVATRWLVRVFGLCGRLCVFSAVACAVAVRIPGSVGALRIGGAFGPMVA